MTQSKKNKCMVILRGALYSTALLLSSGTLIQTFLSELGVPSEQIYLHATLLQLSNILTTVLLSRSADRSKNLIRRMALTQLPIAGLYLLYLPLCVPGISAAAAFGLAAAIGVLQTFFVALTTVCDYKLPYRVIPVNEYGGMIAVSGIATGLSCMAAGRLITLAAESFSYFVVMAAAFALAALMTAAGALLTSRMKPVAEAERQVQPMREKLSLRKLFREPVFAALAVPNLLRGYASGAVTVLATVALTLGHDTALTTRMVTLQSGAMLCSCLLFGLLSRRLPPKVLTMAGSVLMLLTPLLLLPDGNCYLILYTAIFFGRNLVDYAVPSALYQVVPDSIAGPYHAWRLILHSAGSILATSLAAVLPVPVLLASAALSQLISGLFYTFSPVLRKD